MARKRNFTVGEHVVYPSHGVGRITDVETQEVAGYSLDVYVVSFDEDRMTLRIPVNKVDHLGLRTPSSSNIIDLAFEALTKKVKTKRGELWSRRAQEYEGKINSGDMVSIAEVIRDLYRGDGEPEQSYSERQIYQLAMGRLIQELAVIEDINATQATQKVEMVLLDAA
ncbi:MAG: CarD family transcriptional regulator [Pseudomonadota bacterium]